MAENRNVAEYRQRVDVSIVSSTSNSGVVYLGSGMALCGLELPAAFEATTVYLLIEADFTGTGDVSGTPKQPKDYAGAVIDESWITVAATNTNLRVNLSADKWDAYDTIQITCYETTKATPVVQTAERVITAYVRPY